MDIKSISIVYGTALLALTMNASAGPMSITSSQIITPPIQIEQAHYYRHHYRHYGWHRGWHYGWYRGWHRGWPYYGYNYGYGYPYGYGVGTGLAALATAPLAAAAAVTEPLVTGRSVAASGNYCATPVKTCLLYEPGWLGTGCSCKVNDGEARGTVQ
ncbi:hypothetical protein QEV83_04010 [Methylocapsa sp. D3K7]|uniref:hypothetical protein n=1 Tax=Methylocapsa sp. D3K7 TaxID=3041435 RepID=UPI00244ED641|nr:hypothetical protein [Methylocapsa sp. D3K7]WGJ15451.1 hypothetical protein QEV83_04010 [Methylocapsa sp. D3K7]